MKGAAEFLDEQDDGEDRKPGEDVAKGKPEPEGAPADDEAEDPPAPAQARRQMDELLEEFGEALDEIANALQTGRRDTADIGDTLAQMLEVIKTRDRTDPMAAMTKAIKSLRAVTVEVSPTPVTVTPVVQIIERTPHATFEMRFTYDQFDRLETATLTPKG